MKNLVERYIYDVVRRLPEQERDDVGKELRSNIYDMLPENAADDDISTVLTQLGSPAIMAEQYRQSRRYLISPAFYDDYLRTLKWVLPLVGCILMVIGLLVAGADATKNGITDFHKVIAGVIGSGISTGISGAVQALVWVTAGFAIADRVSSKSNAADRWSVKDLPEDIPTSTDTIPVSDSIVELIIITAFSTVGVLMCFGKFPVPFIIHNGDVQIQQLFSNSFLTACIPVIIISGLLGICECIVKIIKRRWSPLVCGTIIVSNFTSIGLLLYLCSHKDIFSQDFLRFAQSQGWARLDNVLFGGHPLVMLIVVIIIAASLFECGKTLCYTIKAAKANQVQFGGQFRKNIK